MDRRLLFNLFFVANYVYIYVYTVIVKKKERKKERSNTKITIQKYGYKDMAIPGGL